ncbi:hypothetical protein J2S51_002343 [Streptomyces sp. DSM 41269]|nr:hypothetical protein [Streptomyces sp. DSM 41269]
MDGNLYALSAPMADAFSDFCGATRVALTRPA